MSEPDDIAESELQQRLLHAFGRSGALLSDAFGTSLKDAQDTIRMAYFHEMKSRGLKLREIAGQLDVSERSVKRLQKGFRETFLDADREYELPVRIEFLLWATPVSRAKVKQLLRRFEPDEEVIDAAIDTLIDQGRVALVEGELVVQKTVHSKLSHTWLARIGGLTSFISNLSDAAYARFIDQDSMAFARTMSFLIREKDVELLQKHFTEELIPLIQKIDEDAQSADDAEQFRVSVCWAPYDYIRSHIDNESEPDS
jgi:transcriptional regulator with XRE-family HTH domain